MKVVGSATIHAPADQVWAALHDPAVLCRAIPGGAEMEIIGPGLAQFSAAPSLNSVAGAYSGTLSVADQRRPGHIEVAASARGERGTATADLTVRLTPAGGPATLVNYEANGVATGALAGIGARLIASAGKRLAADFFSALDEIVTESRPETVKAPARSEGAGQAAIRPPEQVGPSTRPDLKAVLLAGVVSGVAGVIAGILLGRKGRAGRNRG
jgi:uncharacterized protein